MIDELRESLNIPLIANGDFYPVDYRPGVPVMIARAAQANPSVFSCNPVPDLQVAREYLGLAVKLNMPFPNTKFTLQQMAAAGLLNRPTLGGARSFQDVLADWKLTRCLAFLKMQ